MTMNKIFRLLLTIMLTCMVCHQSSAQNASEKDRLRTEIEKDLTENILPFWIKYASDPHGGFHGIVSNAGDPMENAPRGGVLNARILWTFSHAYALYGLEEYREMVGTESEGANAARSR